jgi:hypothetical protein
MSKLSYIFSAFATLSSVITCHDVAAQDPKPASKKPSGEVATQVVVVEGSGASEDEALKNAFRSAVSRVVGAVVSAETIVKDDAIIEEKILTFSDGFIEKYDELPGSKTVKSGVHRIKIKALVQRKNLVAKLKVENVVLSAVDGTSVFAEAVSKLHSERDAAALLEAAFEGFPESCIKGTVVGKPQTIDKTDDGATLVVTVVMEPDLIAYKAFQARLTEVLGKMSNPTNNLTAKFKVTSQKRSYRTPDLFKYQQLNSVEDAFDWRKNIISKKNAETTGELMVVVATSQTKAADRMSLQCFSMDNTLEPVFAKIKSKQLKGQLQLLSSEMLVASEDVPFIDNSTNNNLVGLLDPYASPKIYLVTPAFQTFTSLVFWDKVSSDLKIKLSFEEIKSISEAKVEVHSKK